MSGPEERRPVYRSPYIPLGATEGITARVWSWDTPGDRSVWCEVYTQRSGASASTTISGTPEAMRAFGEALIEAADAAAEPAKPSPEVCTAKLLGGAPCGAVTEAGTDRCCTHAPATV